MNLCHPFFVDSSELWGGVLFFLFCVGFIFYLFGSVSRWIQREYERQQLIQQHPTEVVAGDLPKLQIRRPKFDENIIQDILRMRNLMPEGIPLVREKFMRLKLKPRILTPTPMPTPLRLPSEEKDVFDTIGDCMLYTYSMLLVVSLPRLPRAWPVRLLTGFYWYYCLSIVVAYRASLTAILANPAPRVTIDTLAELADSPIGCGAWGEKNREFFLSSSDEASQKIGSKLETVNDPALAVNQQIIVNSQFSN